MHTEFWLEISWETVTRKIEKQTADNIKMSYGNRLYGRWMKLIVSDGALW
jgi:hypothetical protein